MTVQAGPRRSPLAFFVLVFALAVPFWWLGALAERGLPLPMRLPVSALQAVCPILAAVIMVHREERLEGVRRLLRGLVDHRRIRRKIWYLPALLLVPAIYLLSYGVIRILGRPLPEPRISVGAVVALAAVFLLSAAAEEGGWTGYATGPLQSRWNALTAAVVLGLVWGAIHIVADLQAGHDPAWILWQRAVYDVGLRILIVWIVNNTGGSVLAAVLVHGTDNLSVALFPQGGSHYDPAVTGVVTAIIAVIVTVVWGPRTLARYRHGGRAG